MAFTKKPLKWTALGQEPSELKKTEGFKMDESPAPGHFDFMFRSTYEAIEELQQKAGEVKTVNNVQPDGNGNVLIPLPDTSKLYQKPTSGIPKTDLDATVQASLKKADDAAPLTELAKTNQALTTHQADLAHVHWIGTAVGTNTLTATYEAITTLKNGLGVAFLNTTSSTGATTLNINGFGAIPILKANGNPVTNLKTNGIYTLRYANGNFILQGEGGEYGTATASDVVVGKTIGTENGIVTGTFNGKSWASGTVTSTNVNYPFVTANGTAVNVAKCTVTGLPFNPSMVLMWNSTTNVQSAMYVKEGLHYFGGLAVAACGANYYRADNISNVLGFILPVLAPSTIFNWVAFE